MGNENPWIAFYPEAAKNFDESSIEVSHMAEVVGAAAQAYGTRPAVSTQLPTGVCTTLNFSDTDRFPEPGKLRYSSRRSAFTYV
jgi:hypothetical protein